MYYPFKKRLLTIGLFILVSTVLFSQTNKPVTTSQVPASTQTIATVPGAYNANGQIPVVNYIRTRQALGRITDVNVFDAAGYTEVSEATQYVDGLGRPLQTVMRQATPGNNPSDIVSPVIYDPFSREANKYLPYVQTGERNGLFKNDPFNFQKNFYQNVYPAEQPAFTGEQIYYSQVNYEASPLNRALKTLAAGNSWAGNDKGMEQQYLVNTTADAVQIWSITNTPLTYINGDITTNIPSTSLSTVYDVGQLYKNVTKDEQGNAVVEYKDKEGLVILKKVQLGTVAADYSGYSGFLCTYYVYDDFNQLRFVIPPKAVVALLNSGWNLNVDPTVISELCFRYEYDGRQRMVAKKVPGADWVYMIYDNRDRLVATQDSYLRNKSAWLGTAYDQLNRPVMTGFYYPSFSGYDNLVPNTPANLQSLITKYSDESNTDYPVNVQPPPQDLYVAVRKNTDQQVYKAINSVTFTDEFSAGELAEFSTQLVTFYDWVGSYTPVSGNLYDYHTVVVGNNSGLEFLDNSLEPLTITHYDDYNWTTQSFTDRYNTKLSAGNNLHAENMPSIAQQSTVATRGMVTGTETRIMPTIDNLAVSSYRMLYTIPFYDDHGQVVQTQSNNYKNGVDIQTNLYDFTGKVLSNYLVHTNLDANMLNLRVKTDIEYDAGGRVVKTWKTINDVPATKTLIVQNEYDALGKLKRKSLGQKRDINGTYTNDPIEVLDYSYNIRGWLKGINQDYANKASTSNNPLFPDNWFGMELDYDYGFQNNQLNGNIGGIKWRSAGDGEQRAYGFGYDAVNRLMYADFNQLFGSNWQKDDPNSSFLIDFSTIMGDGINPTTAYDANGNIKAMKQWGLKVNVSSVIDDLTYHYGFNGSMNTNKLLNVVDPQSDDQTKLGDFHYSKAYTTALNGPKPANAIDYVYDANGNMVRDYNKDIAGGIYNGMLYNYLNLPVNIGFSSTATRRIEYTYDAAGNKLSKSVIDGTLQPGQDITKNTDYLSRMVYQDNVLQFIGQEEGRIRYKPAVGTTAASFVYDYFIKDHLGNVRMVLTDEQQQEVYPAATLEGDVSDSKTAAGYENLFYSINSSNIVDKSTAVADYPNNNSISNTYPAPPDNTGNSIVGNNSQKVYRLIGTGSKTGLGITLKVMAGDHIDIFGRSYYLINNAASSAGNTPVPVLEILSGLLGAPGSAISHGSVSVNQLNSVSATTDGINAMLGIQTADNPPGSTIPKAYVNYIFFDEQFKYAGGGFSKVDASINNVKQHHDDLQNIAAPKNGYVYIYCSNESPVPVFFDNLQVVHARGPLLEEAHYYPFGLKMPGISSQAVKQKYYKNKNGFNGSNELQNEEFGDGSGLEYYDAVHRMYDPQIGRFGQIDAFADASYEFSQYAFANDNPLTLNDPLGLFSDSAHPQVLPTFVKTAKKVVPQDFAPYIGFPNKMPGVIAGDNDWPITYFHRHDNDLFDSFLTGYGPTNRIYLPKHQMTRRLTNAGRVNMARAAFYKKYLSDYKKGLSLKGASLLNYKGAFGFWDVIGAGPDIVEQFVGSMKIDIRVDEKGENLLFFLSNNTSRESLMYHMTDDIERKEGESTMMGNMYQIYIFKEPITADGFIGVQKEPKMFADAVTNHFLSD